MLHFCRLRRFRAASSCLVLFSFSLASSSSWVRSIPFSMGYIDPVGRVKPTATLIGSGKNAGSRTRERNAARFSLFVLLVGIGRISLPYAIEFGSMDSCTFRRACVSELRTEQGYFAVRFVELPTGSRHKRLKRIAISCAASSSGHAGFRATAVASKRFAARTHVLEIGLKLSFAKSVITFT